MTRTQTMKETIEAGIAAGLIGGILMGLVAMIRSAVVGLGFWLPMKLVAGTWFGVGTLLGDSGIVLAGMATHLVTAMVWGTLFSFLIGHRANLAASWALALIFGAAVWGVMYFGVMPFINETMFARVNIAPAWFFVYHLVFGTGIAISPLIARKLQQRKSQRQAPRHREEAAPAGA